MTRKRSGPMLRSVGSLSLAVVMLASIGCQHIQQFPQDGEYLRMYFDRSERDLASRQYLVRKPYQGLQLIDSLAPQASQEDIANMLPDLIREIGSANRREMGDIRASITLLRKQPNAVKALITIYRSFPREEYSNRLMILRILGELGRSDALEFLNAIVWEPLPDRTHIRGVDGLGPRAYEEMIKAKCVQGMAIIRNEDGSYNDEAEARVLDVARTHPSHHVRLVAIDALMWNHGDSPEMASKLIQVLPDSLHEFVTRPRFKRGTNAKIFSLRLEKWRAHWVQGE